MAFIADVVPGRVDWALTVRVIRLWVVPDFNDNQIASSVEMILLDERLDRIHASVKRSLLPKFQARLVEGACYRIEKLLVAANDVRFATTSHRFKVSFMASTTCVPVESAAIPVNHFVFAPFREILDSPTDDRVTDVIGHLVERGDLQEHERNGRHTTYIQFMLEDLSLNRLQCTFWGSYADELNTNLVNYSSANPPVLIIQLCKLRRFLGTVGISNSFFSTKVFFNSSIPEITEYRTSMATPPQPLTQAVTQLVVPPPLTIAEEMLQTPKMCISELLDVCDPGVAGLVVRVIEIESEYGWLYNSCNRCAKKVGKVGTRFYCKNPKCSRMVTGVPRFKVEAKVMDTTGSATFVFFNRAVADFLGRTAQQLADSTPPNTPFPVEFRSFFERDLLVKVSILDGNVTQGWKHFAVKRITDDPSIIRAFQEQHVPPRVVPIPADSQFVDSLFHDPVAVPDVISLISPSNPGAVVSSGSAPLIVADNAIGVSDLGESSITDTADVPSASAKRALEIIDISGDDVCELPPGSSAKFQKVGTGSTSDATVNNPKLIPVKKEPED